MSLRQSGASACSDDSDDCAEAVWYDSVDHSTIAL